MWQTYREAVRQYLPDATIVIDKFHAVKMANQAIEQVRKAVRAGLTDAQCRTLMHDRFILLKRDLTTKDLLILETWTKNFPALGKAYGMKEAFYTIWGASSKEEAHARYFAWQAQITPEIADAFLLRDSSQSPVRGGDRTPIPLCDKRATQPVSTGY